MQRLALIGFVALLGACRTPAAVGNTSFGDETQGDADTDDADGSESQTGDGDADGDTDGESSSGPKYDVDPDETTGGNSECKVGDDMDGVGDCEQKAPPDSFEPVLQWEFDQGFDQGWTNPLVGNFTDDNDDGEIDLCDTPDVVLIAGGGNTDCNMYLLSGDDGHIHWELSAAEDRITCIANPAFGDIDDDGLPEIVVGWNDPSGQGGSSIMRIRVYEHDGSVKWSNEVNGTEYTSANDQFIRKAGAIALHDLDNDGDVEIVFNHEVYDHEGNMLWWDAPPEQWQAQHSFGADLDGDDDLEVLVGHAAYHHDGTKMWEAFPDVPGHSIPQVANLDDDDEPEVLITSSQGLHLLEADGTPIWGPVTPTGVDPIAVLVWERPATVHDFDGDGQAEWASSSKDFYAVYEGPDSEDILWQSQVQDLSGAAAGTAFDFLGDGVAEAMYADETTLRVYDGKTGNVELSMPRKSLTYFEYPIVADVDNDGSAEILVVSQSPQPALQVFADAEDRWIQARRIWNQHAYYVTNVREDGTIPQYVTPNWEVLNTFRTNAQIEGGSLCNPVPEG